MSDRCAHCRRRSKGKADQRQLSRERDQRGYQGHRDNPCGSVRRIYAAVRIEQRVDRRWKRNEGKRDADVQSAIADQDRPSFLPRLPKSTVRASISRRSSALYAGPRPPAQRLLLAGDLAMSTGVNECPNEIEWRASDSPVPYAEAFTFMEQRAAAIGQGSERECIWLLEHPPLFTAGTSADPAELFNPNGFPVYEAGRGGRYTYHGPGQRVGYVMLDLERRGKDIRCFVHALEGWLIATLADFGISAHRAPDRIGIWVGEGPDEAKIGALGVRVKRWVTLHGFALNVAPDLSHFSGIVPCGISEFGVTSLEMLGKQMSLRTVDAALKRRFLGFLSELERPCKES